MLSILRKNKRTLIMLITFVVVYRRGVPGISQQMAPNYGLRRNEW